MKEKGVLMFNLQYTSISLVSFKIVLDPHVIVMRMPYLAWGGACL